MKAITCNHRGIEITLDRTTESWRCEIDGNRFSAFSLSKVTERIDQSKQATKKKIKPRLAWCRQYGKWELVTVTDFRENQSAWITCISGHKTVDLKNLYPDTKPVQDIIERLDKIAVETRELTAQSDTLFLRLNRMHLTEEPAAK